MRYGDPVAAGISSAKISADIGLTENQAVKIAEETEAVMQTMEFQKVLHSERWSRLFATMGPENVAASAMAVLNNVNIEHVLRGFGANSSTNLKRFLEDVQAFQSRMAKEAKGVVSLVDTLRLYFEKEAEK